MKTILAGIVSVFILLISFNVSATMLGDSMVSPVEIGISYDVADTSVVESTASEAVGVDPILSPDSYVWDPDRTRIPPPYVLEVSKSDYVMDRNLWDPDTGPPCTCEPS